MLIKKKNELTHHGVKGQRWGVRNGPPYPIDNKVMKKGTRINTIAIANGGKLNSDDYLKKEKKSQWTYTYNANNEWDNKVYKGAFALYIIKARGANHISEYSYETTKDLKMPTRRQREQEFFNLYKDPKFNKKVVSEMEYVRKILVEHKVGSAEQQKAYANLDFNNIQTDEQKKLAYEVFCHAMEHQQYYKTTRQYAKNMSKKYDAMVDDNNQGIYNMAQDPVVIFRANEALKAVENIPSRYLTSEEITNNLDALAEELGKHGKKIQL